MGLSVGLRLGADDGCDDVGLRDGVAVDGACEGLLLGAADGARLGEREG